MTTPREPPGPHKPPLHPDGRDRRHEYPAPREPVAETPGDVSNRLHCGMSAIDDKGVAETAAPLTGEALKQYGFAPGNYFNGACIDCGNSGWAGAKRSWRCEPCALKKHVVHLTAEMEAATKIGKAAGRVMQGYLNDVAAANSKRIAAEAKVAALEAALAPFAALYVSSRPFHIDRYEDHASWPANFEEIADMLTVGNLRKAATLLKEIEGI